MAKFGKVSKETQDLVDNVIEEIGLNNYMEFEVISTKMKQLIKVSRAGKTAEYLSHKSDTVCIYIYEEAFDMLNNEQQTLLIKDALNLVSYDSEKDKINIGAPQITVTLGGRAMFGTPLIDAAETALLAIQQIADREKEEKELKKNGKKKNRYE